MNDRAAYANANAALLPLADKSVHMIATSPPYWGLRSYDTGANKAAELGAEPLHDCLAWARGDAPCGACYVCNLRTWAAEMHRVLRDDGTLWLNLADSYSSGGQRAISYGTSDKEPGDCQGRDCSSQNPCDACHEASRRKSRKDSRHAPMQSLSPSAPNRGNKESAPGHLPTSDSCLPATRNADATPGHSPFPVHESAPPRAYQESTPDEFSRQHRGYFPQLGSSSSCQDAPLLSSVESPAFSHKTAVRVSRRSTSLSILGLSGRKQYKVSIGGASSLHTEDMVYDSYPYVDSNTTPHQAQTLPVKNLCGIPWRVALALQADGWYLRSDVIWAKPNPMPESVTDRPTKAHEYVFLLTKSARYFWDGEGVREEYAMTSWTAESDKAGTTKRGKAGIRSGEKGNERANGAADGTRYGETSFMNSYHQSGRNLRTVWNVATQPYSGAHFATWPPALVERMVKAGTSERGVCPECGAPWRRVVDKGEAVNAPRNPNDVQPYPAGNGYNNGNGATTLHKVRHVETVEWRPTCGHADAAPVPAIVLDPFAGSGTTLLVARQLGRVGLGFDLSETYLRDNAAVRLGHDKLAAWGRGIVDTGDYADLFRAHANGNGARSEP